MSSSESEEDKMDIDENEDIKTEKIVINETRNKIINENSIIPTQVPKLKCDFSLTKTEDYCSKIDLPMHPSFFKNNIKNNTKYEKYVENLSYFKKKRKRINDCFSGMWFVIWDTNEKTNKFQFKVGQTYGSVSSGCPLYSVVSFGCNQNYVFVKKENNFDFVTDFSSHNDILTGNKHFVTRCNLHFVRENDESRHTVNGVAVLDNGASGVVIPPTMFTDLPPNLEKRQDDYYPSVEIFGKNNDGEEVNFWKSHCRIGISNNTQGNDNNLILLGNEGFLFDIDYFYRKKNNVPTLSLLRDDELINIQSGVRFSETNGVITLE